MTTERVERRLAAILNADVVGFSRLMDGTPTLKEQSKTRTSSALVAVIASVAMMAFGVLLPVSDAHAQDQPVNLVPLPPPTPLKEIGVQRAALGLITPALSREAPADKFTDGSGNPASLDDFRGRVVLVHLWATWCVPWCREELPTLDGVQAMLGGSDFEVVAVSVDRNGAEVVPPFFEELHLSHLEVYLDPTSRLQGALGIIGIPTTVIYDRHGSEIGRAFGSREWDSPTVVSLIRRFIIGPDEAEEGQ